MKLITGKSFYIQICFLYIQKESQYANILMLVVGLLVILPFPAVPNATQF